MARMVSSGIVEDRESQTRASIAELARRVVAFGPVPSYESIASGFLLFGFVYLFFVSLFFYRPCSA